MRKIYFLALLSAVVLVDSCSSGKSAYKHGDYYDAVLASVQRLRQNPDHKKSREVLNLSYQAAVDLLESDAQNQIASNANFKYRAAVVNYERINNLYEEIRTSPGALRVIPKPVNRYKELTEYKAKAAEESYEAGIQSMMKNTREDAKTAYFLFSDANNFSPGYREAIEMIEQARFNATLKVVMEPSMNNYYNWNFDGLVLGYNANQFVKVYTPQQASDAKLPKVDQFVKVVFNSYNEAMPTISRRVEEHKDSVKVGEKTVNGVKKPIYEQVNAKVTVFEKRQTSRGSLTLWIGDGTNQAVLLNQEIIGEAAWTDSWAIYTGDLRAIASGNRKLIEKRESKVDPGYLQNQAKRALDENLQRALASYFSRY